METKDILDNHIYPRLDRMTMLADLNPKEKGKYLILTCPSCGKREAYIYHTGLYIKCNRLNQCGYCLSLWDYIQQSRQLSNKETLLALAQIAGYNLPNLPVYSEEKETLWKAKADVLETALSFFKDLLWTPSKGNRELSYAKGRGYSGEEIEAMELGYFPPLRELEAYLTAKGYSPETIRSVGLSTKGLGETHTLAIAYRDSVGRLKGFIVRTILEDVKPKYLFTTGVSKDTLFNIHEARGLKRLVVTEGFFDALIATQRGMKGIVALGGASLTSEQVENAKRIGVSSLVLALDNDKAGQDGTERAIELLYRYGMTSYVVELPQPYKDPDELICTEGVERFVYLVDQAISAAKWKAKRIAVKHDLATDQGKHDAITEGLEYDAKLNDSYESHVFLTTLTEIAHVPLAVLESQRQTHHDKQDADRLRQGYADLLHHSQKLWQEGDIAKLRQYLDEKTQDLKAKAVSQKAELYSLEALQEDVMNSKAGLRTGYESLDKIITIPQAAITIIAGRPSHGKTSLMLNLFLRMLQTYPHQAFYFFSYEESKRQLGLKLINILSGDVVQDSQNIGRIENYIRGNHQNRPLLEKGKREFQELTACKRLWLIDEPYYVEDLGDTLCYLKELYDIGAVFVDYIQKVKIKTRHGTRQLELQKISEQLLEMAKRLSLPIILGAQLGRDKDRADKVRLDNLREAGDIEQDANLVIGLYNEAMGKAQEENKVVREREVDITLTILKNRNGMVNETVTLCFDRPILTIREKTGR